MTHPLVKWLVGDNDLYGLDLLGFPVILSYRCEMIAMYDGISDVEDLTQFCSPSDRSWGEALFVAGAAAAE